MKKAQKFFGACGAEPILPDPPPRRGRGGPKNQSPTLKKPITHPPGEGGQHALKRGMIHAQNAERLVPATYHTHPYSPQIYPCMPSLHSPKYPITAHTPSHNPSCPHAPPPTLNSHTAPGIQGKRTPEYTMKKDLKKRLLPKMIKTPSTHLS